MSRGCGNPPIVVKLSSWFSAPTPFRGVGELFVNSDPSSGSNRFRLIDFSFAVENQAFTTRMPVRSPERPRQDKMPK